MKKKLVLIIVIVAVFAVSAGGTYFLMSRGKTKEAAAAKPKEVKAEAEVVFSLGDITTNLADTGLRRYIMVDVALGVASEETAKKMEKDSAAVKDAVIAVLRGKRYDQVAGEAGMTSLKKELQARINQALGSDEVKEVFFAKFVVE